jgi:hypothetical protein
MALRIQHGMDTPLLREQRLWYPLDWYRRLGSTGKLPLFVFLDDGRGSEQFARDVGIEKLVRSTDPADAEFHPAGTFDFRGVVALFLEAPQLSGRVSNPRGPMRVWSTPPGRTGDRIPVGGFGSPDDGGPWQPPAKGGVLAGAALGLLAAGGNTLVYPLDDLGYVVEAVNQVILGFQTALGPNMYPRVAYKLNTPDGAIDEEKIFLVAMGTGATLALAALGQAANATGGPLFAGACVLGGTIGGKAINDPGGLFPGVRHLTYSPTVDVTAARLLSVWFDPLVTGSATTRRMQGADTVTDVDTSAAGTVPADDSALQLVDIGYKFDQWDTTGNPDFGEWVRLETTHAASMNQWAAAIQAPLGIPLGAAWSAMAVQPLQPDGVTPVPVPEVRSLAQVPVPQVAIWQIRGLKAHFWPTSQPNVQVGPQAQRTGPVVWEPLVEIIRFLLAYP